MNKGTKKYLEFSERLNERMDARKIKAHEISVRLEVSVSTVNFWRSGEMLPRYEKMEDLARLLDISPGYLMFGTGESHTSPGKHGTSRSSRPLPADRPVLGAVQGALDGLVAAGVTEMELMPVLEMLVRLREGGQGGKK